MNNKQRAKLIAERSLDSYMADDYGKSWAKCAEILLREGLSDKEAEAVLRSKHMRWADDSQGRGEGNKTNSAAFDRYLVAWIARLGKGQWLVEVRQLRDETFGDEGNLVLGE